MRTWTAAAREELEQYFGRVRPALEASGADVAEVIDDLRRHLEQEAAISQLEVVTEQDVRRLLARIGAPEPPASEASGRHEGRSSAVAAADSRPPGHLANAMTIGFGIVLPTIALVIEWMTGMCAGAFFDPLPTLWHAALVALVPLTNWLLWRALSHGGEAGRGWVGWAGGLAAGVELYYALIFLPLMLPGLLGIVFYGWGLLPLSPVLSMIVTLVLIRRLRVQRTGIGSGAVRGVWPGFAVGLAGLVLLETPEALTRYGLTLATDDDPRTVQRGINLLRAWGDRDVLLRDCYGRTRAAENMDLVGWVVTGGRATRPEKAREIYYRVTGQPFNSVPAPKVRTGRARWAGLDDWTWDLDQAGERVGGRIKGLTLHSSRLDAVVEPDAAIAYCEWTMEFKNDSARQREARAQILLPPGGVVSRLTLWVNGEEREAAFAGRGEVREAYEKIVRQRRDPVLVTTAGPDRVLMQCFPVPPDGGIMKVRLGITAPLEMKSADSGLMRWPHAIERNYTIHETFRHQLWVEGPRPLTSPGGALQTEQPKEGWHAIRGQAQEADLWLASNSVEVSREGTVREVWARDTRGAAPSLVRRTLRAAAVRPPARMVIVIDGSQSMDQMPVVAEVLAQLPSTVEASVIIAGDQPVSVGTVSADTRDRLARWRVRGGQDNVPALVEAWDLAAQKPDSLVVWICAPVPVVLESAEGLRQRYERRPNGPSLMAVQTRVGPNRLLEALDGVAAVQLLPRTGDLAADLRALFRSWTDSGNRWEWVQQREADASAASREGAEASSHLVRLWAKDEIRRLAASRMTEEAVELAGRYQLVTPVSGAVVLETAQQYRESGLEPVPPSTVPSIPEPSTWALLVLGTGMLLFVRRRRASGVSS